MCDRNKQQILAINLAFEFYIASYPREKAIELAESNWKAWRIIADKVLAQLEQHN